MSIIYVPQNTINFMKKYFLDQKYKSFTQRIIFALSVIAFWIGYLITSGTSYRFEYADVGIAIGFLSAMCPWIIYGVLRWILTALPDKDK